MPANLLRETSNCSRLLILPMGQEGRGPCNRLKLTSNTVSFLRRLISGGRHPVRLLLTRRSSFRVLPILPIVAGMQPPKSLLASTNTDTGEFPRLSGIPDRNLLLFRKMASRRGLPKIPAGILPSNSLNRRSKYLREGIDRITFGNLPTKRLLLRSSSRRSFICLKVSGRVPQNRFELRWKSTTSVSHPSSGGRYPAMSAWFRSMPVTTLCKGWKREGAQNMPE